jgi:uncharacterized RDD family membrane protein YckC
MPCPLCGDICRCSSEDNALTPLFPGGGSELRESAADEPAAEDAAAWRQEVAARLHRYKARRKPRPPRYPSLRLRFEGEEAAAGPGETSAQPAALPPQMSASNLALSNLAFDQFAASAAHEIESPALTLGHPAPLPSEADRLDPAPAQSTTQTTAKIIEFPRSWTPAPAPLDELAEAVCDIDSPRILEAPEVVPPPPALGGITIEPAPQPELERRPGIDFPLQSAPLLRRVACAAIDGMIVAAACALFGFIFWKMSAIRPPRVQLPGVAAGLFAIFWPAYEYLLLVYSGSTPGMRLAQLQLARFDGRPANRRLRRWRVLASFLSAASLGMGYAWAFLDEDALCWHDRITHTYLAPKKHGADPVTP